MDNSKQIYNSIDLFKLFASFLVVAIHTHPFDGTEIDYYFTSLCRIAVPFFFVATSYFFFRRNNPNITSYIKRLGKLYFLWFLIEIPWIYQKFFIYFDHSLPLQILNLIRSFIFSNTWWASWYIMACILGVIIIFILERKCKLTNRTMLLISICCYSISLLSSSYAGLLDCFLNDQFKLYHKAITWCFCPANSFIVAMIYLMIGKILAQNNWRKYLNVYPRKKTLLLLLLLAFLEIHLMKWSVWINDSWLFLPPASLLIFILLLETKVKIRTSTALLMRNSSILIYIIHSIVQYVNITFLGMKGKGIVAFIVTLIGSIIFAWGIIKGSKVAPCLKNLY